MSRQPFALRWFLCLIVFALVSACQPESNEPRAWIDTPTNGASVNADTPVSVVSHAYAPDGIAEIVLLVNGEAYRRNPPVQPGATFSQASHEWQPKEGTYTLRTRVYSKSGTMRDSAPITVQALGKEVSPTRVPTASTTPDRVTPVPSGAPDLALVGVEAIVAGEKSGVPFCNTRVTYRNAGTLAIPRNFAVQFAFNGTPVFTNTVAGGLPPGATADLTFVYQFEGTQYIGINLDVGNAITESDEANNAFAEARMCGAPRTISPTPVVTLTPTRTPTSGLPPASCVGAPNITSFSASPASILVGQSATLSWGSVTNAESVSLEPGLGGVASPGSRSVSPNTTTTYTLVARCGSNSISRQATVSVTALPVITIVPTRTPTRTPTKPSDAQGPPAPSLVAPKGNLSCRTSVTLDWNAVSDPSGIKHYIVKWTRNDGQTGGTVTTNTQHTISVSCNRSYTWSVQAVDNADNPGATGSASFTIQEGVY